MLEQLHHKFTYTSPTVASAAMISKMVINCFLGYFLISSTAIVISSISNALFTMEEYCFRSSIALFADFS